MSIVDAMIHDMTRGGRDIPKLDAARIAELKSSSLPHADCASIGLHIEIAADGDAEAAEKFRASAVTYLQRFLPPGECPNCDRRTSFEWGITHGEGACRCGYPGRGVHSIGEDGEATISGLILWYHPSELVPAPPPGGKP